VEGTAIVDGSFALNAAGVPAGAGVPVAVTAKVAEALGVAPGWAALGPQQTIRR
jgi:hypothetical protein